MRLIFLTPGAGGFHCGSCLRDHDLARALRRRGHDVLLAPLYLPPVLDHAPGAGDDATVRFGGVSAYAAQAVGRLPRLLARWLDHPRVLRWAAARAGLTSPGALGPLTVSMLRGPRGRQRDAVLQLTDWVAGQRERWDAVVLSNALLAGLLPTLRERAGVPVVVTLQGEDTFVDALPQPWRARAWALLGEQVRQAARVVAVSGYHADVMAARLALPRARIAVVHNGIELADFRAWSPDGAPVTVAYLARLCPAKGLHTLVAGYVRLRRAGVAARLVVGGAMTRGDEPYVERQRAALRAAGVADDVQWRPNLDRAGKLRLLREATVLSVPATYGESFGLYVLEALAAGVPVVQPRHAAFPEVLQWTGGGVLVEPDDPAALADALTPLLRDPAAARALGAAGRRGVFERFGSEHMAERFEAAMGAAAAAGLQSAAPTPAEVIA